MDEMKIRMALDHLGTISLGFPQYPPTGTPDYRRQIREQISAIETELTKQDGETDGH